MKHVAFLRAINVGGHTVKMDRLCELFEALKLRNVETFIASGNVIFDSTASAASLEARIEKHLEKTLGYAVATLVRSLSEVAGVAKCPPFANVNVAEIPRLAILQVGFLKSVPDKSAAAKILALSNEIHEFKFHGRELYWFTQDRRTILRIPPKTFERALGSPVTFRNVNTVRKLAEKYPA